MAFIYVYLEFDIIHNFTILLNYLCSSYDEAVS
jgi:hypothetical protein